MEILDCAEFQTSFMTNLNTVGTLLSESQAKGYLKTYFQNPDQPLLKKDWVFGHAFGLDMMKEFIDTIYNFNADPLNQEKIAGVRIYNGKSQRNEDPYASMGILHDVFIVPVKTSGEDYFIGIGTMRPVPVTVMNAPVSTQLYILGQSRPCPNQCGNSMLLLSAE